MTHTDDIVGVAVGVLAAAGLAAVMTLAPPGPPRLRASDQGPGWFAYAPRADPVLIVDVSVCLDRRGLVHITDAEVLGATPTPAVLTAGDGEPLTSGFDITTVCPGPTESLPTRAYVLGAGAVQVRASGTQAFPSASTFVRLHYVTQGEQAHLDVTLPQH